MVSSRGFRVGGNFKTLFKPEKVLHVVGEIVLTF